MKERIFKHKPSYPKWAIEDLKKSGLKIEEFPIVPLIAEEQIKRELGYTKIDGKPIIEIGGYFIKYPNKDNYKRLKLRNPVGKCKYLSPKGRGNHPYIMDEVSELASSYKPDTPLFFIEGEKKACKASIEGFPSIGLTGVWGFKDSETVFLKELEGLNLKHRDCFICFDSDISEKTNIKQAELRLAVALSNRGANPISLRLPCDPDGSKNGIDDFLVKEGPSKLKELINTQKGGS